MNYEAIAAAHIEAESRYPINILSSWIVGSQHAGLANEESDIDILAIYTQNPLELVCQNPTPKDRITTLKIDKVEIKLVSLQEFCRYIKNNAALSFEALFYATEYFVDYDNLIDDLKKLFFDVTDKAALIKALLGIVHRNRSEYQSSTYRGLTNYNKTLMISAKYGLLAHLVRYKDFEFFKETPDLARIASEDPEVPLGIKGTYDFCDSSEIYHAVMDYKGEGLFASLGEDIAYMERRRIASNRSDWQDKEYKDLDHKVDSLVVQYYREIYSF